MENVPTSERSTPFDPRMEEVVESFLGRLRGGERPTVAEYAEKYPDLAAKIREVFPGLLLIEGISARSSSAQGGSDRSGDTHPAGTLSGARQQEA
jgi:hypothetical protein